MNNTEITTITLEEWLKRAQHVRTATKELVRLWMANDLGCQKELANHLAVDKSTVSRHVKALVKEGKLEPSDSNQGKRNDLQRSCTAQPPVENVEVAIPHSPAAAIPYAQPIEDQLDEARQRIKELEAELEQAREANKKLTVAKEKEARPEGETDPSRDYERCLEYVDAIIILTKKYFKEGWQQQWWSNISGELSSIGECCEWHCRDLRTQHDDWVNQRIECTVYTPEEDSASAQGLRTMHVTPR